MFYIEVLYIFVYLIIFGAYVNILSIFIPICIKRVVMKKGFFVICVAVLGVVLPSCSRTADIDKRVDDATMRTLTINLEDIEHNTHDYDVSRTMLYGFRAAN